MPKTVCTHMITRSRSQFVRNGPFAPDQIAPLDSDLDSLRLLLLLRPDSKHDSLGLTGINLADLALLIPLGKPTHDVVVGEGSALAISKKDARLILADPVHTKQQQL